MEPALVIRLLQRFSMPQLGHAELQRLLLQDPEAAQHVPEMVPALVASKPPESVLRVRQPSFSLYEEADQIKLILLPCTDLTLLACHYSSPGDHLLLTRTFISATPFTVCYAGTRTTSSLPDFLLHPSDCARVAHRRPRYGLLQMISVIDLTLS